MSDMVSVYGTRPNPRDDDFFLETPKQPKKRKISQNIPSESFNNDFVERTSIEILPSAQDPSGINFFPQALENNFSRRSFSAKSLPPLAIFLGIAVLLLSIFPLLQGLENGRKTSGAVLGSAIDAYGSLKAAEEAMLAYDLAGANINLASAYQNFDAALTEFENLSFAAELIPQATTGKKLLYAAREATLAMQYATLGLEGLVSLRFGTTGIAVSSGADAPQTLRQSLENFQNASRYMQSAESALADLEINSVPAEYRESIAQARDLTSRLRPSLKILDGVLNALLDFSTGEKTYLILFQNNRELRATGGFIGTYGILRLNSGKMEELKIESIYNPDGQLKELIAAPGPLQRNLSKTWAMRDSNWFFDYPSSAKKAAQFLEKETGIKVDGVLAFTPELFTRLLSITGPIYLPEYRQELNEQNFMDVVWYQTSVAYDRKLNQPKKFLADFAPLMLEKISQLNQDQWLDFMNVLATSLKQKDIMVFSFHPESQNFYEEHNWAGSVKEGEGDYLAIINTNVGAGKTDQDIKQKADLKTRILPDGTVLNTLTLFREHNPGKEKEFPTNVDFIRIFVPEGSRLISASGFDNVQFYPSTYPGAVTDAELKAIDEKTQIDALTNTLITEENGKTVFANWAALAPNESREMKLQYVLPERYDFSADSPKKYTLFLQKQPGAPKIEFSQTVFMPARAESLWQYPEGENSLAQTANFNLVLDADRFLGTVFSSGSGTK